MKIIFTTPFLEYPPKGGPRLRAENSIKALASIADVVLVSRLPVEGIGGPEAVEHYQKYCSNVYIVTDSKPEVVADKLTKIASVEKADLIWMSFGSVLYDVRYHMIKQQCRWPVVMDTDSIWSRFVFRGLSYAGDIQEKMKIFAEGVLKRWEESWGTALSHVTTAVSEVDAMYYRLFNKAPYAVDVFSNVIDPASYTGECPNPSIKKPCVYLAGTFWPGSPMEQAAVWFLKDILPIVRQSYPQIHTYIIGTGITDPVKNLADSNVTIAGRVESVLPYLKNADVALVPLMFESGTRFKIMEAGICSIPVVSTTLGAEGIPVTHGHDILIADETAGFAGAIVQLLNNPAMGRQIAANCRKLIERKYSIDYAASEARSILSNLSRSDLRSAYNADNALDTLASRIYPAIAAGDIQAMFAYAVPLFSSMISRYGNASPFILDDEKQQIIEFLEQIGLRVADNTNIRKTLALLTSEKNNIGNLTGRYSAQNYGKVPSLSDGSMAAMPVTGVPLKKRIITDIVVKTQTKAPKPWTPEYYRYRAAYNNQLLKNSGIIDLFRQGVQLPDNYATGLDERSIEYPWFFAVINGQARTILDAGSALNHPEILDKSIWSEKELTIITLAPEGDKFHADWIKRIYADLRSIPVRDEYFDEIVCISTLEHIGMDNTQFTKNTSYKEEKQSDYRLAVAEMSRVLRPGGRLLLTVPFGRHIEYGEFQLFDREMIDAAADCFGASQRDERYYYYSKQGWKLAASPDECGDFDYSRYAIECMWGSKSTTCLADIDEAVAARAVACCAWQKA